MLDTNIELVHLVSTTGGCENRDPAKLRLKERERTKCGLCYHLKNQAILLATLPRLAACGKSLSNIRAQSEYVASACA